MVDSYCYSSHMIRQKKYRVPKDKTKTKTKTKAPKWKDVCISSTDVSKSIWLSSYFFLRMRKTVSAFKPSNNHSKSSVWDKSAIQFKFLLMESDHIQLLCGGKLLSFFFFLRSTQVKKETTNNKPLLLVQVKQITSNKQNAKHLFLPNFHGSSSSSCLHDKQRFKWNCSRLFFCLHCLHEASNDWSNLFYRHGFCL